jgi:hypothetical protein
VTRLIQVWSKRCPKFPILNDLGGRFLSPLIFLSLSLSLSHMLIFFPSPPARRPQPSSRAGLSISLSGRRVRAASPLRRGSVRCAGITRTTTHASCWGRKPHPLAELGTRNPIIPPPTADARGRWKTTSPPRRPSPASLSRSRWTPHPGLAATPRADQVRLPDGRPDTDRGRHPL